MAIYTFIAINSIPLKSQTLPIKYSLRVSLRARYVRLAVKPYTGLEIVIPKRFPRHKIPHILLQHEAWISRQLQKQANSLAGAKLPDSIAFAMTGEEYSVDYSPASRPKLVDLKNNLLVHHQTDLEAIRLLRQWMRKKAQQVLIPKIEALADEFGFQFKKIIVRSQKTRWGSCSSTGAISLNDQLLFLAPEIVRYLMIHELCHTRQMNHSRQFWALVARFCPDYRCYDKTLSKGREQIPYWFGKSLFG